MNTLLLALSYLFQLAVVFLALLGIGALILPRVRNSDWGEWAWNTILRYGVGLAAAIFITIILGSFGLIHGWALLPLLSVMAILGWIKYFRHRGQQPIKKPSWSNLRCGERVFLIVASAIYLILNINILIGGLCPSMAQDVLWYHLSVPLQWSLTGSAAAFPYVMQSNYSLGLESAYAVLLLFSDEILCSMLYAQIVLVILAAMSLTAFRRAGLMGGMIVTACIVPFTAITAPVIAANDCAASLFLLLGFVSLVDGIEGRRVNYLLIGFLLGSALAVKMVSMIFCGPIVFFWLLFSSRRKPLKMCLFMIAGIFIAFLPWAVRGWRYSGNPVFPVLSSIFPVRPEYQTVLAQSRSIVDVYEISRAALKEALFTGVPYKIHLMMDQLDIVSWLILIACLSLIWIPKRSIRFQACSLLGFYAGLILLNGRNEVLRFISIGYPLAAPALAAGFVLLAGHLSRRQTYLFLSILIASAVFTYAKRQAMVANYHTIQWKFRPVLTKDAIDEFARHAEFGKNYLRYEELRGLIEPDARVFLADETHPYYLKRKCIWGDEVAWAAFQKTWSGKSPEEMREYLRGQEVGYVVCLSDKFPVFGEMETRKYLKRINTGTAHTLGVAVWKME